MQSRQSRRWLLSRRPKGLPVADDFTFDAVEVPPPDEGEVIVEMRFLSLDPAMRGWMNEGPSYVPAIKLGQVVRAYGVGQVVESRSPRFDVGDWVTAPSGLQSVYKSRERGDLRRIDPALGPVTWHLGVLGMTGLSAYFGLFDIGEPREGETVLVSGAAGAVGSIAGQLARIAGCRVVGVAGGEEKCRHLVEDMGFDGAIDYQAPGMRQAIKAACPDGIDVYFDNVGGETLEAALTYCNDHARVVMCGAISQYNATELPPGPRNIGLLIVRRIRMQGFIVMDFAERYGEAVPRLAQWAREGQLQSRETIVEGIETFPAAFLRLFSGEKMGKLMLAV